MLEELDEKSKEKVKKQIHQLYDNQSSVYETLDKLDRTWKFGEDVQDQIDSLLIRFEALRPFFDYVLRSDIRRHNLLEELDLLETDEAKFLDILTNKYYSLADPLAEFAYIQAGIINYLHSFGREGSTYDPINQTLSVQISLYSRSKKIVQMRNLVEDFIWLACKLLEVVTDALNSCSKNKNVLSPYAIKNLEIRFAELKDYFQKFEEAINNYNALGVDEVIVASAQQEIETRDQYEIGESGPAVDLDTSE